jgi:hypothetical protein
MQVPIPNSDSTLPQWAINCLIWVAVAIVGLYTGFVGWFTRKYIIKVDFNSEAIAAFPANYATIEMVTDMEDKLPGLVSRTELVSYMQQMRDDQLRMHRENLDNGASTRADIRAVHERVDALFRNGHAR